MNLKSVILFLSISLSAFTVANSAEYEDKLSACFTKNTTDADELILAKWVFLTISDHPAVKDMSAVNNIQKEQINKDMAMLSDRIIHDQCNQEVKDAMKHEGRAALQRSLMKYGQSASQGFLSHSSVVMNATGFMKHMDVGKMATLLLQN